MTDYTIALQPQHAGMLAASGIDPQTANARGYRSIGDKAVLERIGITPAGRRTPGLLVPMRRADGSEWGFQYRPDDPRERGGKPVKYETPTGQRNGIDVPPAARAGLADLTRPLWVTEGTKKADAAAARGLVCVALPGVWSWKGKPGRTSHETSVAVADWDDMGLKGRGIVLAFDSDVMVKPAVRKALEALAAYLLHRGVAEVRYLVLPDVGEGKTGLDDFLAEHDVDELGQYVHKAMPEPIAEQATQAQPAPAPRAAFTGDPARLLDDVETFVRRFCVLPSDEAYVAVTLWAAHTHFIGLLDTTGRLACLSPEPGSGKTRVLEVLDTVSSNPLLALDLSMSAFFRIVNDNQPTILLDEVDAIFTGKSKSEGTEDLRRVINNGYRTGAVVQRVGGQNRDEVQSFRVFTPVAMAGLGNLPDTLMSRSIILRMKRRAPGESVEPWRDRIHRAEGNTLQADLAAWAGAVETLPYPDLPEGVADRDADVWEPLLMVADHARGHWPDRARRACLLFIADKPLSSVSLGVRLLVDLRAVWPVDRPTMSTADLLLSLGELDEAPWADLYGEGLKPRKLAHLLGEYGIRPTDVRTPLGVRKGYRREDLWDAWQRYAPTPSAEKGGVRDKGDTAGHSVAERATPSATPVTESATPTQNRDTIRDTPQVPDLREHPTVAHVAHVADSQETKGAPTALFDVDRPTPAPPTPALRPVDIHALLAQTEPTPSCSQCGEPLAAPGLLARCRPAHTATPERKSA
ncbi:DUF3631 domain-containing protein [Xylanimonas allomyrinae]|uniref:DUF3631 domain-containing protein n=1 Tax=Xylanimonas allomyrinae TaxID=2509459 RepID=A0A4P6EMD6_9MICO|nr:DUF3631 domain-containing protein [Xylanimonas allomyrinae]QAY62903.1 DUF3631 domain-containing protein [Xylanimonas allomyrinae]